MGLFAGSLYAAETAGENVTESTYTKNDKTYECLTSVDDNGYLTITQIVPNSSNVKIKTYVEDKKLLISGVVNKGTQVTIKVYNKVYKDGEPKEYILTSTGTFSQSLEIQEGTNTIVLSYCNKREEIDNHIIFEVTKIDDETVNACKDFLLNVQ